VRNLLVSIEVTCKSRHVGLSLIESAHGAWLDCDKEKNTLIGISLYVHFYILKV